MKRTVSQEELSKDLDSRDVTDTYHYGADE